MSGIFGPKSAPQAAKQQPIGALNVQTSIYGAAKTLVYGTNRVPVNLIHYKNFKAIPHTEQQKVGGKGGSKSTSSTTYTYQVAAALFIARGEIDGVGIVWKDKDRSTMEAEGMTLFNGGVGQVAWSFLTTNYPSEAVPYAGDAYLANSAYQLGESPSLPNYNVEVKGLCRFDGDTIPDAEASAILTHYLSDARNGAGFGPWLGDLELYRKYCTARGLFFSPIEANQRSAGTFVKELADLTNAAPVMRNNKLTMIPYGDEEITGNGETYTPDLTPLYDLDRGDYIYEEGQDPVKHLRTPAEQAYNHHRMEFNDRAYDYNPNIAEAKDFADIDENGLRSKPVQKATSVTSAAVARDIIQITQQRDLYVRNGYGFRLGVKFSLLEPMDFLTLTEESLGLDRQLVRVLSVTEEDDYVDVETEEVNVGMAHAPLYGAGEAGGPLMDFNAAPGAVLDPLMMNAPGLLTDTGFEVWIAVAGPDNGLWGGAVVWMSEDDITYKRVGNLLAPARYGTVAADFAAGDVDIYTGAHADETNVITANLYRGQMLSGTDEDVDEWRTLLYVGGEWIAYKTATFVSDTIYDISILNRGGYGSASQPHVVGHAIAIIDEAIFRLPYERGNRGKQVYFKFTSFNIFGGGMEDLADVVSWPHVLGASEVTAPMDPDIKVPLHILAGVVTVDCSLADVFTLDLTEDVTIEFVRVAEHRTCIIEVTQEGAYDITLPDSVRPVLGTPYVTTKTVGAVDVLGFLTDNAGVNWNMRFSLWVDPTGGNNTGSGVGAGFKTTITPNPAYAYATSNPSLALTATPENGTTPYTVLWFRSTGGRGDWAGSTGDAGGADFTCSNTASLTPTFSRTGTADGYVAQNWICRVTDAAGNITNTILEIALEDDGEITGGHGGWDCPAFGQNVLTVFGDMKAEDVRYGERVIVIDPDTLEEAVGVVERADHARGRGVRVTCENGVVFECSASAPVARFRSTQMRAGNSMGHVILTCIGTSYEWSLVTDVEDLGEIDVVHITITGPLKFFLIGSVSGYYGAHHNIKNLPRYDDPGYYPNGDLG